MCKRERPLEGALQLSECYKGINRRVQDPELAAGRLKQLRRLGVRIAIDDFGTGYSSLSYLQQVPIDQLKIDRSFVATMLARPGLSLAGAVIQIAHSLGITPIAEGIEKEEQAEALLRLGCDLGQGFHLGRPLPAEAATEMLLARRASRMGSGTSRSSVTVPS